MWFLHIPSSCIYWITSTTSTMCSSWFIHYSNSACMQWVLWSCVVLRLLGAIVLYTVLCCYSSAILYCLGWMLMHFLIQCINNIVMADVVASFIDVFLEAINHLLWAMVVAFWQLVCTGLYPAIPSQSVAEGINNLVVYFTRSVAIVDDIDIPQLWCIGGDMYADLFMGLLVAFNALTMMVYSSAIILLSVEHRGFNFTLVFLFFS